MVVVQPAHSGNYRRCYPAPCFFAVGIGFIARFAVVANGQSRAGRLAPALFEGCAAAAS